MFSLIKLNVENLFDNHNVEVYCKYSNYFQIYDYIFLKVLNKKINFNKETHILEIEILRDDILQILGKLFKKAEISGLELKKSINYICKSF